MRYPFLLTTLGLTIGLVTAAAWYLYSQAPGSMPAADTRALPQYERWSKHNQCGGMQDTYDATLVLKAQIPEALAQNINSIRITDSRLDQPTELAINRADLGAEAGGGFAPICEAGSCVFTIFYPAHRAKPPTAGERRDFTLAFKSRDQKILDLVSYRDQAVPTPEQAASAPPAQMMPRLADNTLTLAITPRADAEIWIDIALNDGNGPRQAGFAMPSGMSDAVELPFEFSPPLREASVIMTVTDQPMNQRYRHHVTLADDQDPFFDCAGSPETDQNTKSAHGNETGRPASELEQ